jgi:hypothetical protein
VRELWLIDPGPRTVEVWTGPSLPGTALEPGDVLTSAVLRGFALPLADLFA